jgi:hypothetical protein
MGVVNQYGKMKVGVKSLEDATLNLGALTKGNKNLSNKPLIMKALAEQDLPTLRAVSNYFYRTSGIYQRICNYFAATSAFNCSASILLIISFMFFLLFSGCS